MRKPSTPTPPHRIVMLALPPAQTLDVTGPLEVFAQANAQAVAAGRLPPYRITLAAPAAGPVATSSGVPLVASRSLHRLAGPIDTLVVAGGEGARAAIDDARLVAVLRGLAERASRVASVCTGAFPLAATGLLDGRRAATHWGHCRRLAERFPALAVEPDAIFVSDGKFHTSAGVTAGIDLALALVEADLGRAAALAVARHLVVFLKRPGGQSQFSAHLVEDREEGGGRFGVLARWMADHLGEDLSVEALARRAAMSPRNFARRFRAAMGATPGAHVRRLRVEAARHLLAEGDAPMSEVARRCGFGTLEAMRLAFQHHLNVAPQQFRERFRRPLPPRHPGGLHA